MRDVIVCSLPSGGVAIVVPSAECVAGLRGGGLIWCGIRGRIGLRSFLVGAFRASPSQLDSWERLDMIPLAVARAWEVHKLISEPRWRPDRHDRERIAERWVDAMIWGGVEEDEALRLIADKDAPAHSTAAEIINASELPIDRTHRDAWRRSSNGGPVWIDETIAQQIDEARMWAHYEGDRHAAG